MAEQLTRPIIGIEHRTAQEVFDIMCDRIRATLSDKGTVWHYRRLFANGAWSAWRECDAAKAARCRQDVAYKNGRLQVRCLFASFSAASSNHEPFKHDWVPEEHRDYMRELEASALALPDLRKAVQAVLDAPSLEVHVGYDEGAGGGNFVYADAVRLDDESFVALRRMMG